VFAAIYEWVKGMDSQVWANVISSGIGVVAIVGLIIQSHSTRKQVKLQNFVEYTKRYQEVVLNFPENINEDNFTFDSLEEELRSKTMRYMRAYFDLCFEEYTLHDMKFIDKDLWKIWKGGMKVAFSKPAFQQAWKTIKQDTEFGEKFETFLKNPDTQH